VTTYEQALDDARRRYATARSADALLSAWDAWVADCESGYRWTAFEYNAELSLRDQLESFVRDSSLNCFPEHIRLRETVTAIDERFRGVLHPEWILNPVPREWDVWWRTRVLRRAGPEYAHHMREHGFPVEIVNG
jgi:hypothetical protein